MVVRTELTDIQEGSVLYTLCATVAEQIAEADVRLAQIRDQFTLDGASGVDLDERAEELGLERLPATTATGVVRISRTDTTVSLTIEAGATFGRSDSDVTYVTVQDYTMSGGVSALDVAVSAQVLGTAGNASSASINTVVDAPSGITSVFQASAISNGREAESDATLRSRARRYMNSLARCQPSALEFQALTFTASDNTRASVATLYEDPVVYGRTELLIDDGSGLGDSYPTRDGLAVSQYISSTGVKVIGTERSISNEPSVVRTRAGVDTTLIKDTHYTVKYGAGIITLLEGAVLPGDTVGVTYKVHEGIVGELQSHIEGRAGDVASGYRPAGVTVRVLPAPVTRVSLDLLLVVADGANITTVVAQVEAAVTSYLSSLGAGAPAFVARMIDVAMGVADVENVSVYKQNTSDPAIDLYTASPRHVLRAGQIQAVTSTTGA
jgi:hypothetical protein